MKKLIAILILCLLCYSAEARNLMVVGGGVPAAGGGCTTANDTKFFGDAPGVFEDALYVQGSDYGTVWRAAMQFTISATTTVTQYDMSVFEVIDSGNITLSLYTDSANTVGTQVSGSSKTQAVTTTGVNSWVLDTPKSGVSSGTYWIVAEAAEASVQITGRWRNWGLFNLVENQTEVSATSGAEFAVWGCQ